MFLYLPGVSVYNLPRNPIYRFAEIDEVDRFGFTLFPIMLEDDWVNPVFNSLLSHRTLTPWGDEFPIAETQVSSLMIAGGTSQGGLSNLISNPEVTAISATSGSAGTSGITHSVKGQSEHDLLYYLNKNHDKVLASLALHKSMNPLTFEGDPGAIKTNDYLVLEDPLGQRVAVKVSKVIVYEDSFDLHFVDIPDGIEQVKRVYGPFKHRIKPKGYDHNPNPVTPGMLTLEIAKDQLPDSLRIGKTLIVEPEKEQSPALPFSAQITDIGILANSVTLTLNAPASAYTGYQRGGVIIRGNCLKFGHGETQPPTLLGSGDATENNQVFIIKKDNISFIADSHLVWGVRADIEIIVDGRRYEQVSTFDQSGPGDAHYTITLIENGHLKITFGDGKQARRLPSGYNNVSMTYRIGSGSLGNNVVRNSLNTLVKSDIRTISVRQPFATSGGQDAESPQQIRENAPRHLQSLGRAISLSDFEHIAETTSGIWHAKAFQNNVVGRRQSVSIVVVPANDAPLGQLRDTLSSRLNAVSSPSIDFTIHRFYPVALMLSMSIRVDSGLSLIHI